VTVPDDPPAAHALALEATALAERLPETVLTAFVAHWRGVSSHVLGRREEARAAFQRTIAIGRALRHAAAIAHSSYFLGRLETEEGNLEAAHRVLAESLTLHAATGNRWGIAHCLEWLGRMAVAEGEADRAVHILGGADRLREELGSLVTGDDRRELDRSLVRARAELGEAGFVQAWKEGRALSFGPLLVMARGGTAAPPENPPPPDPAPVPGPAASDAGGAPERPRLEVAALGPLQLTYAGVAAPAEAWSSVRTRELLLYLLLHPGGATKEEVGVALWPEASPAQVRNSFHVTLHRLRSALGDPAAVRFAAGRYSLDPQAVGEIDAARFEREVRKALPLLRSPGAEDGARKGLAAALELYRGPLFAGETGGEWLREPRERLRLLHVEALAAAARLT
jgi:tetratricopeptide (TPR) repeat protein